MTRRPLAVGPGDRLPSINLYAEIENLIRQIPEGRVSTVMQLATALGDASASKAVHGIVRDSRTTRDVPWHRVVTAKGSLITSDVARARDLLAEEGLFVTDGQVQDLENRLVQSLRSTEPLTTLRQIQLAVGKEMVLNERQGLETDEIAGVDVAYRDREALACCIVMDRQQRHVAEAVMESPVEFPYIPTYLAFREGPSILRVLETLREPPDVLLINGSGIAHPRRCGIATHIGVVLGMPTIGVTTSLLSGSVPGKEDGTPVYYEGKKAGVVIQTRSFRPIYVSPGHMVSLDSCYETVKAFTTLHRLPEPIWRAHARARALLRSR